MKKAEENWRAGGCSKVLAVPAWPSAPDSDSVYSGWQVPSERAGGEASGRGWPWTKITAGLANLSLTLRSAPEPWLGHILSLPRPRPKQEGRRGGSFRARCDRKHRPGQHSCPSSSWKSQDHMRFQKLGGRGLEWGGLAEGKMCVFVWGRGCGRGGRVCVTRDRVGLEPSLTR